MKKKHGIAVKTTPSLIDTSSEPITPSRTITVNGPLYTVKISEKGAVFKSFVLKKFKETINADSPLLEMISPDLTGGTVRVGFAGNSLQGLNGAVFSANTEKDTVDIKNEPQEISFSWTSPQGVAVEKKYLFSPETYMIGLNVNVKMIPTRPLKTTSPYLYSVPCREKRADMVLKARAH